MPKPRAEPVSVKRPFMPAEIPLCSLLTVSATTGCTDPIAMFENT